MTSTATPTAPALRGTGRALARAGHAAALIVVLVAASHLTGFGWPFWVLLAVPDLTLIAGGGPGLAKGQLRPEAVRWYNAAHSLLGPVLVLGLAALTGLTGVAAAGFGWAAHVLLDRALGYGRRGADGFRR